MILQKEVTLPMLGSGFFLITDKIIELAGELPKTGIMNLHLKHTSAGITMNENADPSVRYDFKTFFSDLVDKKRNLYTHTLEGYDDMPAHIKASLIGQDLTIPITNHRLNLGTWQGIWFCEFRNHPHKRNLTITIIS
jgi:secondary thiamine-phosphate synthase enzyme